MAKVTGPLFSVTASGQFAKTLTYDKRGFTRKYVIPANPQSVDQMTVRNILGDIQRELKTLGLILRPQLKAALGYRWNTLIIQELTADDHAAFDAFQAEWAAMTTGKAAWVTADVALGLVNPAGGCLFAVASALYDVALRVSGDGLITLPVEANGATVGAEWIADA